MKNYPTKTILFAIFVFWVAALEHGFCQTPDSLDRLIEKCSPKATGPEYSLIEEHFPKWEGAKTVVGLNLILDKHMAQDTTIDANIACARFLKSMELPKDQIAMAMKERIRTEEKSGEEPWKVVYLLRKMEELIDREKQGKEVVPFIASFLNDKRPIEPLDRGPEAVPRQLRRVCDGATSALISYMEATGLCDTYDTRFGNPGGETMWEGREKVMRAVVQVLQEKAFLPADFWANLPPPRLPKDIGTTGSHTPNAQQEIPAQGDLAIPEPEGPESAPAPAGPARKSSAPWKIIVILMVAACSLLLWLLLKRRS